MEKFLTNSFTRFISDVRTNFDFYCHISFDRSTCRYHVPNETKSITKNQNDDSFFMSVSSASYAIPFMISLEIYERDRIYDCLRCFPPLTDNKTSFQIYYLISKRSSFYTALRFWFLWVSLHTHLAEVMEAKDHWNRHRRKRQIIRTRKAKGYNGFDINCSCVCRSCYPLYDIFSKYGCLSKNSDRG